MDEDAVWRAIDAARLGVVEMLEGIDEGEWRRPSLCAAWTVRDVAAHLTLQQLRMGDLLRDAPVMMRSVSLDRAIRDLARRRAERPTAELVAEIRRTIGSRRHNVGVTYRETLVDILVHGQDMAIPLGRRLAMPPEASATAAERIWGLKRMFHARSRFAPYRLTATDAPWTVGSGLDVHGPAGALLLLITGRAAALPLLKGAGVSALRDEQARRSPAEPV